MSHIVESILVATEAECRRLGFQLEEYAAFPLGRKRSSFAPFQPPIVPSFVRHGLSCQDQEETGGHKIRSEQSQQPKSGDNALVNPPARH